MNQVALITGASSGIGAVFARRLAEQGYDLILVARRRERLESLAGELGRRSGISAEVLCADLAGPEGRQQVADCLEATPNLHMLVNNAGFGVSGAFQNTPVERQLAMLAVHVLASTQLAHAALKPMLARPRPPQGRRGAIINVSSVAAFIPLPGSGTYSATKGYLNLFSEGLANDLAGRGVRVQALCPGFTHTEFHDSVDYQDIKERRGVPAWLWLSPEYVVDESLKALERGSGICIPSWKYRLAAGLLRTGIGASLGRLVVRRRLARRA